MPDNVVPDGSAGLHLTACQVRAALAMRRWSVEELARRSKVSRATLRRIMSVYGVPNVLTSTMTQLRQTFEAEGFQFLLDDGTPEGGPGLRYGRYPGRGTVAKL